MSSRAIRELEKQLMNLTMAAKGMERQSRTAEKNEKKHKDMIKKCLQKGNQEGAKIHAESAIREKNQQLHYLKLAARLQGVCSRIETAVAMQNVTISMKGVVKGLDRAMHAMNLAQVTDLLDKFEKQQEDIDVKMDTMDATFQSTSVQYTNQTEVEDLMTQVSEEHGLEMDKGIADAGKATVAPATGQQDELQERLAALRQSLPPP
mmetsp:Transcript_15297/g.21407  ORF Transcript_15297/g.21407 Transcript_15297/m.21407 type:complete len:206 (+) Transcript_15297:116-733(+)